MGDILTKDEIIRFAELFHERAQKEDTFNRVEFYQDYLSNIPKRREVAQLGKMLSATTLDDKKKSYKFSFKIIGDI